MTAYIVPTKPYKANQFRVDRYENGHTIYSKYINFFLQVIRQF